jgi:predicted MFS family arabinose efflux permease
MRWGRPSARVLTALLARQPVRQVLVATMLVLAAGSVAMAGAPALGALLGVRFAVGLAHGVFMAVASHAATSLVDPSRAGRALSIVWLGLTLALAGGVPLGTWLGAVASWRWVFAAIGVLALCGGAGLLRRHARAPAPPHRRFLASLRAILQPALLLAAGVAALVSVATFRLFTYISPFLLQLGGLDAGWLSAAMLCFGACAIGGNLLGGWCADRPCASPCWPWPRWRSTCWGSMRCAPMPWPCWPCAAPGLAVLCPRHPVDHALCAWRSSIARAATRWRQG